MSTFRAQVLHSPRPAGERPLEQGEFEDTAPGPGEVAIDLVKQVGADPRVERAQLAWTLRVLGDSQRRVRALLDQLVGAQG